MRSLRSLGLTLTVVVALTLGVSACSLEKPDERPALTDTQAQELSLARFTTYQLGTVSLEATFTTSGDAVELTGWVDYRAGVGYVTTAEDGTPRNLLMWTRRQLALAQVAGAGAASPPLPQPELDGSWGTARMDATRSELQQILVVIISLGSDRPDNALLVAQNGARFVRTERIGGQKMDVYAVPPNPVGTASAAPTTAPADQRTIDYWIDSAGAIRRATFTLASGTDVTVTLARDPAAPRLHDPFDAAP